MAITHQFIEGRPLLLFRLEGACTGVEAADVLRSVARDERLAPGTAVLWDGRLLTHFYIREENVDEIVAAQRAFEAVTGPGRSAIVAVRPEDDLTARLFVRVIASEVRDIRVFPDLEEALAWLGASDLDL
ncbi:MAG: hypothetical protein R3362_11415 [Rhodothermales bacterium]|nr:hypothetical protein [Rhodothermales bacterium]